MMLEVSNRSVIIRNEEGSAFGTGSFKTDPYRLKWLFHNIMICQQFS